MCAIQVVFMSRIVAVVWSMVPKKPCLPNWIFSVAFLCRRLWSQLLAQHLYEEHEIEIFESPVKL